LTRKTERRRCFGVDETGSGTSARQSFATGALVGTTNGVASISAIRPDDVNNEPAADESRR